VSYQQIPVGQRTLALSSAEWPQWMCMYYSTPSYFLVSGQLLDGAFWRESRSPANYSKLLIYTLILVWVPP